jgi:hypothetical protein
VNKNRKLVAFAERGDRPHVVVYDLEERKRKRVLRCAEFVSQEVHTFFISPGTDVMILKIFSPKNLAKILAFFAQTTASFCKNLIIILVFEEKTQYFRRKLAKNAENCDHNIDPWTQAHDFDCKFLQRHG